jgi:DNA-directed RNA polymerase specialized sigma24 family protein
MPGSVTNALHDWERGNPAASQDLDLQFRSYLLALVRGRRNPGLKGKIDSEGVVNEALKSFLTGVAKHEFPDLSNRQDVKNLLVTLVKRILSDQVKALRTRKRDPEREEGYAAGQHDHLAAKAKALPTAEQIAEAREFLEKLPEVVRTVHKKAIQIMTLSLEGLTNNEIADEVDLAPRTVQKIKCDMLAAWEKASPKEHSDG